MGETIYRSSATGETILAECGCLVEAEGEMDMVLYCPKCRPVELAGLFVCECGAASVSFEALEAHFLGEHLGIDRHPLRGVAA
ncbi:MAG: hypothetical protein ACT4OM_13440 [Actinomycetota bacterium]